MCGIVGYVGQGNSKDFVISGLKKLEYRGYDSWGIGLKVGQRPISPWLKKNRLAIIKETGKIGEIKAGKIQSSAQIGIGHTRWATHGAVTRDNAHPHLDCSKNIAVVHNGIINNYQEIREHLIKQGHKFISETDTEVIPHLVEEYLKRKLSFKDALRTSLSELKGDYALCLISSSEDKIYLAANGCPLAIGLGKKENFISSDMIAFADKTQEVVFLKDGTLAEVSDEVKLYDIKTGKSKRVQSQKISPDQHKAELGNYHHFLFKEISEQPEILENIAKMDRREIETNAALIRTSFGTFFVACGTAYHAALTGSYLFAQNAKTHVNASLASEFPNFKDFITEKTLLFAISQSGETADVLEAVKEASAKKAKILSLVNNPNSTLARLSDVMMVTPAGREIAVLSTKAFTSQMAVLYLLSLAISGDFNQGRRNLKLASMAARESLKLTEIEKIKKLAKKIKNVGHLFTIGRSLNYPTALEAALKIKEVSYIHAEGFAGGELKHGTIALIEDETPCIVFIANDEVKDEILSNAEEIKSRGGYIIGVSPENNKVFDYWFKVADIPEVSPIINIIPMQVLAYYLALERGLDPDKPRNLAKSVTVK